MLSTFSMIVKLQTRRFVSSFPALVGMLARGGGGGAIIRARHSPTSHSSGRMLLCRGWGTSRTTLAQPPLPLYNTNWAGLEYLFIAYSPRSLQDICPKNMSLILLVSKSPPVGIWMCDTWCWRIKDLVFSRFYFVWPGAGFLGNINTTSENYNLGWKWGNFQLFTTKIKRCTQQKVCK